MSSIINCYNYDIFISYRQKDNKYDGWVTEFVDNLKKELEATFKEEIGLYFDINPHDGLLETHDVDASLKEKLICLIFIPIISRTYCDPKSFAWEHEFKAFVEQASQDQFGLKIRLPNGNVVNRVLPVRIHDLDQEDIKLCESILGGVMRGVEFIYKEPGVNRSLSPKDHHEKNLNNTNYRNQINKVALAIKEIILGLKTEQPVLMREPAKRGEPDQVTGREVVQGEHEKPAKLRKSKLLSGVAIIAVLIVTAIIAYPKIFKKNTLEKLRSSGERISVAVMPFQNMTNDTNWNVWQAGIQFNLITSLSNYSDELKVSQPESINNLIQSKGLANYVLITPSVARTISQKLDANVFICGNLNKEGTIIRINAQLVDSKTEEVFKSFQLNGTAEKILPTIDSLSMMVKDFLIITNLKKEELLDYKHFASTKSTEAYSYFIYAENARWKLDFATAQKLYSQALSIDSSFTTATMMLSLVCFNQGLYDQAKIWCLKAYEKRDQMPMLQKIYMNWVHALCFETPYEEIKYLRQIQEINDQMPITYWSLGNLYNGRLFQYEKAIPELEKALKMYNNLGIKPMWVRNYTSLGLAYHKTHQYKKEKKLYKEAEQDFPNDPNLIYRQAILALSEGDIVIANRYIEKYKAILIDDAWSEAAIKESLATIYSEAGLLDKAEEYYRQSLLLEPENDIRLNDLAYFLIDKDQNIVEGIELADKALELSPDKYSYLDTKGWGLYKQGNNSEAQKILKEAWNLKPVYSPRIFIHLEAANKAVASQKRTD
jgi:tetratricopeptide (TPR) repeat protein